MATKTCLITALALVATMPVSCKGLSDTLPSVYKGNISGTMLAVPARYVMMPVRYDDEDDWHPPNKPQADRTYSDHISSIEFFIDLDRPDTLVDTGSIKGRWPRDGLGPSGVVFGHLIGAGATSGGVADNPAGIDSVLHTMSVVEGMVHALPAGTLYGLKARAADRNSAEFKKAQDEMRMADLQLYDHEDQTLIFCDYRFTVPGVSPRRNVSTCQITVVDPQMHVVLSSQFDRVDLPQWRKVRSSMLSTIRSFRDFAAKAKS